jgi:hypothetical protein
MFAVVGVGWLQQVREEMIIVREVIRVWLRGISRPDLDAGIFISRDGGRIGDRYLMRDS